MKRWRCQSKQTFQITKIIPLIRQYSDIYHQSIHISGKSHRQNPQEMKKIAGLFMVSVTLILLPSCSLLDSLKSDGFVHVSYLGNLERVKETVEKGADVQGFNEVRR